MIPLGRADTALGPWVRVKFAARSKVVRQRCWVNPKFLDYSGNISTLDQLYPDKAPLILFEDPRFPAPAKVSADRTGNQVSVTWTGYVLALGDRESATSPRFLLEFWTCIGGQIVFPPWVSGRTCRLSLSATPPWAHRSRMMLVAPSPHTGRFTLRTRMAKSAPWGSSPGPRNRRAW